MTKAEQEFFYIGVNNPSHVRKLLLQTTKDVILALKRFETFKDIRTEKAEEMITLNKLCKEISFLNNKVKMALPETSLRATNQKENKKKEEKEKPKPKKTVKKEKPKPKSEIEKLEEELNKIEHKMSSI